MEQNGSTFSKGGIAVTVDVNMPEDSPIQELRSPSHPIAVALGRTTTNESQSPHLSKASATLSLGTSTLEKDFVLEIVHQARYFDVNPSYSMRDFSLGRVTFLEGRKRLSSPIILQRLVLRIGCVSRDELVFPLTCRLICIRV